MIQYAEFRILTITLRPIFIPKITELTHKSLVLNCAQPSIQRLSSDGIGDQFHNQTQGKETGQRLRLVRVQTASR